MPCVTIIEDDADIAALVVRAFQSAKWRVVHAADGATALELLAQNAPDLIVLDLGLPDIDGMELLRRIRRSSLIAAVPVMVVTGKSEEADKVVGLELGADDYVTKPFGLRELLARAHAVLRRTATPAAAGPGLSVGAIRLDVALQRVTVSDVPVPLRAREFALLERLLTPPLRAWNRAELLQSVWGLAGADQLLTRTVDVHIQRLRHKLGAEGRRIVTLRRTGYVIDTSDDAADRT